MADEVFLNGKPTDGDTALRRVSDIWADKVGTCRVDDYFDLISKFLRQKVMVKEYVEFVEREIETLVECRDGK